MLLYCRPVNGETSGHDAGLEADRTLLHLPIKDAKHDRHGLQSNLPAALAFVSTHLQHGRKVLVLCTGGGLSCPAYISSRLPPDVSF